MVAAAAVLQTPDTQTVEGRLKIALENYRSWAGGLGLIHNNFGTDWATELSHAEARVLRAFEEFLAGRPSVDERRQMEEAIEAEGLDLPLR